MTVNVGPGNPPVTVIGPVVAPEGTPAMMVVGVHVLAAEAGVPLNLTVAGALIVPKFVPVIVMAVS